MNNVNLQKADLNRNIHENTKQPIKQERPQEEAQLKEHCSSKAGKAIRGVALGLMLAASVAGGAAAMKPVRASAAELPQTSITQEISDVNAVSESETSNSKSVTIACHGYLNKCEGQMKDGCRRYQYAQFNEDGTLEFYTESHHRGLGDRDYTTRDTRNIFDLQSSATGAKNDYYDTHMTLQTGTKFEETGNQFGDYVMIDENCKITVYDKNDNVVGTVQCKDYDQLVKDKEEAAPVVLTLAGLLTVGGIGTIISENVRKK